MDLYLPSFRWGLVVKQDATEAFALVYPPAIPRGHPGRHHVLVVALVAVFVAKNLSRPVIEVVRWPKNSPAAI